jgi:hypothetical protein
MSGSLTKSSLICGVSRGWFTQRGWPKCALSGRTQSSARQHAKQTSCGVRTSIRRNTSLGTRRRGFPRALAIAHILNVTGGTMLALALVRMTRVTTVKSRMVQCALAGVTQHRKVGGRCVLTVVVLRVRLRTSLCLQRMSKSLLSDLLLSFLYLCIKSLTLY